MICTHTHRHPNILTMQSHAHTHLFSLPHSSPGAQPSPRGWPAWSAGTSPPRPCASAPPGARRCGRPSGSGNPSAPQTCTAPGARTAAHVCPQMYSYVRMYVCACRGGEGRKEEEGLKREEEGGGGVKKGGGGVKKGEMKGSKCCSSFQGLDCSSIKIVRN